MMASHQSRGAIAPDPSGGPVVKVPEGATPGSSINVTMPHGGTVAVEVPAATWATHRAEALAILAGVRLP